MLKGSPWPKKSKTSVIKCQSDDDNFLFFWGHCSPWVLMHGEAQKTRNIMLKQWSVFCACQKKGLMIGGKTDGYSILNNMPMHRSLLIFSFFGKTGHNDCSTSCLLTWGNISRLFSSENYKRCGRQTFWVTSLKKMH